MKHAASIAKSALGNQPGVIVDSPTLARLVQEVRNERDDVSIARNYDRTHNRHNR